MDFVLMVSLGLVLSMVGLGLAIVFKKANGRNAKKVLGINVVSLFGMLIVTTIVLLANTTAYAQEEATSVMANAEGLRYLAAALSTGLASIGAGIAVAATGSAALGAISEDSSLLGKTLIFVGLAEGIAIYGLIVTILILNQ
ncbi:MAG: ATPase [Clostridiales bacterium]|nr:ATPase [Clostridiales bacterium]